MTVDARSDTDDQANVTKRVRISTACPAHDVGDFAETAHKLHAMRRPHRRTPRRVMMIVLITVFALVFIVVSRLQ